VRALETDPDSIAVSSGDRALGKCAGLHVNQARKLARWEGPSSDAAFGGRNQEQQQQSPEFVFHEKMANVVVEKASEKEKVKDLANAYSTRWGRVAGADLQANRTYGADLARNCIQNDIPVRHTDFSAWQARQDDQKRVKQEGERRQAEEVQKRLRAEEDARRASLVKAAAQAPAASAETSSSAPKSIDFSAEAKKSARILGCNSDDVRVVGVEGRNILFSVTCASGQLLDLTCDQSGLCLRK
jgi:hypothetical protein